MGRWVCVAKNYPQYLIAAEHARMLIRDWFAFEPFQNIL
jgi:hypothetical protein